MIYRWDHETSEFRAWTESNQMVAVVVRFNISRDDIEVIRGGNLVFKKAYSIEIVEYSAYDVETGDEYKVTKDDLRWWESDIEKMLEKEFERQTEAAV